YLDQLLEEYVESKDDKVREEIYKKFFDRLWGSKYCLAKYKKKYQFKINKKTLNYREDLIELFNKYQIIEFDYVKSSYYNKSISSIDAIRISINNLYAIYFDKDVYYDKEYYKLLKVPKNEYYKTINNLKNGNEVNFNDIRNKIDASLKQAEIIKEKSINRKLDLKWNEYKKLINEFLKRIFNNFTPIYQYEQERGWELKVSIDGWDDDHFAVRYICKSLSGYLKDYKRSVLGFKKTDKLKSCEVCGKIIKQTSNAKKYCENCKSIKIKERHKKYNAKRKTIHRNLRKSLKNSLRSRKF
ncbi:MAG: hypothetical protein QJR05_11790, partial [Thermoanaerobacterium sp.]|nr:hypothetical protein [Thermoanaerobacterium sp.]